MKKIDSDTRLLILLTILLVLTLVGQRTGITGCKHYTKEIDSFKCAYTHPSYTLKNN